MPFFLITKPYLLSFIEGISQSKLVNVSNTIMYHL